MRTPTRDAHDGPDGAREVSRFALTDEDLIRLMLRGSDAAWRAFLCKYRALILATAQRIALGFSAHYALECEEVYSALLAALLANDMQKLRAYDPAKGARFSSWIARLTANLTWDMLREARRRSALQELVRFAAGGEYEFDVGGQVTSREECSQLARACADLSANDRRFFELFYVECADPVDVAAAMRISVKTVYTKNHKLRTKLRSALDRDEGGRAYRSAV